MEYLFGETKFNGKIRKTLRIKVSMDEDFPNYELGRYQIHEEIYPDVRLMDRFKIDQKIEESTDVEGNRYIWYLISEYNRNIDRSNAVDIKATQYNDQTNAKIDYVAMMTDVDIPNLNSYI